MYHKDKSIWSKILVTAVIDDSVFWQWLRGSLEEVSEAYGKFFSGQYKAAVYGYEKPPNPQRGKRWD